MASRYVPRSDVPGQGDLLRFNVVRDLQAKALERTRTIRPIEGLSLTVTVDVPMPKLGAAEARRLQTELRKVGENIGATAVRRAIDASKKTVKTRLFISSWRSKTTTVEPGVIQIEITNTAPYAGYVHRSGEKVTVEEAYVRPAIRALRGPLATAMKAAILRATARIKPAK